MPNGFIDVEQGRIFYQETGKGEETIVWVHGLPLNSDCWYAQFQHFQSRYRNIALDLRGYGQSSALPEQTASVTDLYVSDILALFTALKLEQPTLVGFASGGHATLRLAAQHSEHIRRLITINGSPCFMQHDDWPFGFTQASLQAFIEKINQTHTIQECSEIIFPSALKEQTTTQARQAIQDGFDSMLAAAKKQTLLGFFNNIADDDDRKLIKNISVPTLLITSRLNVEVPPAVGLYLRQNIAHAQLVEINGIDQFAFVTQSALVNRMIEQFMQPQLSICLPPAAGDHHGSL